MPIDHSKLVIADEQRRSLEGRDPRDLGRAVLEAAGLSGGSLRKVIRAKCLDCCCNQQAEVGRCTAVACPLWPYRMGTNPFTNRHGPFAKNRSTVEEIFDDRSGPASVTLHDHAPENAKNATGVTA
jgi:hypothetical protein